MKTDHEVTSAVNTLSNWALRKQEKGTTITHNDIVMEIQNRWPHLSGKAEQIADKVSRIVDQS